MHKKPVILIAIAFLILLCAGIFFALNIPALQINPGDSTYETRYFNPDTVTRLDITISPEDWEEMIKNAEDQEWHTCTLTLNGDEYKETGIRTQGGMTLTSVAETDSTRFSFKFKADKYVSGQSFAGLDEFVIRNEIEDPTYMREYLSYELLNCLGVPSPLYAYAAVYLNGEYFGLYLMVESVNESFIKRTYNTDTGKLYKAGKEAQFVLAYTDDEISSYEDIFESAVSKDVSNEDKKRLIEIIHRINTDSSPDACIDADEIIRYLAANTAMVNTDSYMKGNNYIVYEAGGKIRILPWDFDRSFGLHRPKSHGVSNIHFPIDSPVMTDRYQVDELPLLKLVLSNEEYKKSYHRYLKEAAEEFLQEKMGQEIDRLDVLIGEYVKTDPTGYFSYDEYKAGLAELRAFAQKRAQSILGQLAGEIAATHAGQAENPEKLVV